MSIVRPRRTWPAIWMTHSPRTDWPCHARRLSRDRKDLCQPITVAQVNEDTPPWSRTVLTQPHSFTRWPTWLLFNSPQLCVRIMVSSNLPKTRADFHVPAPGKTKTPNFAAATFEKTTRRFQPRKTGSAQLHVAPPTSATPNIQPNLAATEQHAGTK